MTAPGADGPADVVIVGAGAAGSVLAARLSEDPGRRVVLVEAGADVQPGREPADIRSVFPLAAFNRAYMWPDTRVHWRGPGDSPAVPLPQGRIIGGSSAIMGMWAIRGVPSDYDSWAEAGATGWGWAGVLPYFRKLETDADFGGPLHGASGPVPIRREPVDAWSPLAVAVRDEARRRGLAEVADLNGEFGDGHCVMPNSRFAASRGSSGICYLTDEVRRRPNLRIVANRAVDRLILEGRRAVGVSLADGGAVVAREVVVAAGALRTPVLLMRAGIGDPDVLEAAGITPAVVLRGVGANLQNHPVLYLCALLKPEGRETRAERPAAATYLRLSSGLPGCPAADMSVYVRSYLAWHALGRRMASLAPSLQRPFSRGRITLAAEGRETIAFNLLDDERDMTRMKAGFALAAGLFAAEPLRAVVGEAFVLTDAARLMRFNDVTRWNAVRAAAAAALAGLSPDFGMRVLGRFARLRPAAELVADDARLTDYVREAISGTGHVCGTCRMGDPGDPQAVCDPQGRVLGVAGLRVGDASLMPSVPSGNTHIPTVMLAEKLADAIRGESGATRPPTPDQQEQQS